MLTSTMTNFFFFYFRTYFFILSELGDTNNRHNIFDLEIWVIKISFGIPSNYMKCDDAIRAIYQQIFELLTN